MSLVAIRSIRHSGLKRFFERGDARRLPPDRLSRIAGILAKLDGITAIADMDQHDYRLHPLKGDRKGYWSVRVSANCGGSRFGSREARSSILTWLTTTKGDREGTNEQ